MEVWQLVIGIIALCLTGGGLIAAAVAYLIKIERTLAHLSEWMQQFFASSTQDRSSLWAEHTKLRESHGDHETRITRVETKVETFPHQIRTKPA